MFLSKNKKNRYTPANSSFAIKKVGFKGVYITLTCFPDGNACQWTSLKSISGFELNRFDNVISKVS